MASETDTTSPVNGDAIRQLRVDRGWKQKDLERQADVSLSTVQRAERSDGSLKASTVRPIAEALGVDLSDIYDVPPTAPRPLAASEYPPEWFANSQVVTDEKLAELSRLLYETRAQNERILRILETRG